MNSNDEQEPKKGHENLWRVRSWFPELDDEKLSSLRMYHLELLRFNQKMSLISKKTESEADRVHFADSVLGGQAILEATDKSEIYDIGSGNGFPGLVMAILAPERKFILIDSDSRKIQFLKHIVHRLELDNVEALHERAEDLPAGSVGCAVSRGFASIAKSVVVLRGLIKPEGEYFHFKSENWVREVSQMPTQVISFWQPKLIKEYDLPGDGDKVSLAIVVTKKIK